MGFNVRSLSPTCLRLFETSFENIESREDIRELMNVYHDDYIDSSDYEWLRQSGHLGSLGKPTITRRQFFSCARHLKKRKILKDLKVHLGDKTFAYDYMDGRYYLSRSQVPQKYRFFFDVTLSIWNQQNSEEVTRLTPVMAEEILRASSHKGVNYFDAQEWLLLAHEYTPLRYERRLHQYYQEAEKGKLDFHERFIGFVNYLRDQKGYAFLGETKGEFHQSQPIPSHSIVSSSKVLKQEENVVARFYHRVKQSLLSQPYPTYDRSWLKDWQGYELMWQEWYAQVYDKKEPLTSWPVSLEQSRTVEEPKEGQEEIHEEGSQAVMNNPQFLGNPWAFLGILFYISHLEEQDCFEEEESDVDELNDLNEEPLDEPQDETLTPEEEFKQYYCDHLEEEAS